MNPRTCMPGCPPSGRSPSLRTAGAEQMRRHGNPPASLSAQKSSASSLDRPAFSQTCCGSRKRAGFWSLGDPAAKFMAN
jgi:hypothetical protein